MAFHRRNARAPRRSPPSEPIPPVAGKLPPHDLGAERATLSACILESDALPKVRGIIREPNDFFDDANKLVFRAILAAASHGPIDRVTVGHELQNNRQIVMVANEIRTLERQDLLGYLVRLLDETPSVANVAAHARIVADCAKQRAMIAAAQRIAAEGYFANDLRAFADDAREHFRPFLSAHDERETRSIVKIGDAACETIMARAHGEDTPIATNWREFDKAMRGGFWPGFHSLVSGTGMGKTQFALDVAAWAAAHEAVKAHNEKRPARKVRVYGLELSAVEMWTRCAALLLGVSWSDLLYGGFKGTEAAGIVDKAREVMDRLPLDLREVSPLEFDYRTIDAIRYESEHERPSMVIIDYMQLVGAPDDMAEDARRIMGKTAVAGREVARSIGIPVIGISSCARTHYGLLDGTETDDDEPKRKKRLPLGQGDPRRLLAVAKESGDVEYASDSVLVIGRNAPSDPERPLPCDAWLGIAKARFGAGGWVKFSWNGTAYSSPKDAAAKDAAAKDAADESGFEPLPGKRSARGRR